MLNVEAGNPAHRQPAKTTGTVAVAPPSPPMPSASEFFPELPTCGRAAPALRPEVDDEDEDDDPEQDGDQQRPRIFPHLVEHGGAESSTIGRGALSECVGV